VLAIGDELLLGRTLDTNSAHCARWLHDHGLRVDALTVVGDRQDEIESALRRAADGAALVLCTGGLGPTDDDRTRHALAAVMGVALAERPAAWRAVQVHFQRLRPGAVIAATNRRQALMPLSAHMLVNDRGTAPGLLGRVGNAWVACFPGVPHEMVAMLDRLGRRLPVLVPGRQVPAIGELHVAGLGESRAQVLIGDLLSERDPQVGITASELGHLTLRVVGSRSQVRERLAALRRCLRGYALPAEGLAPSLIAHLVRARATITAAESVTCGHILARLGAVPGASLALAVGFVTYADAAKTTLVGVPARLIRRHGVVSAEVATALARGARRSARATIALASTGVAGPDGGSVQTPVGTVWLACASAGGVLTRKLSLTGNRERIQRRAASEALLLAWEVVSGRAVLE